MISVPLKAGRAERGRCTSVLKRSVGRRLRQRLWHRAHISVPEGLYTGVVGICVIILKIGICRTAATALPLIL